MDFGSVNWDAVAAIGQAVGALGVIVSVLYLAMQVREDARARRAETVHQQTGAHANALQAIAVSQDLAAIFTRGITEFETLGTVERARFSALLSYFMLHFQDSFFQHAEHHLDERVWQGIETPLSEMFAYPGVRAWWKTRAHHYSAKYRRLVDGKIAAGDKPKLYGEDMMKRAAAAVSIAAELSAVSITGGQV